MEHSALSSRAEVLRTGQAILVTDLAVTGWFNDGEDLPRSREGRKARSKAFAHFAPSR
jgi:hypothetical protein